MKKHKLLFGTFFLIVFSTFISGCSGESKIKTEEQKQKELILKNKIRKMTEYHTSVLLGIKQNEKVSEIKLFNEKGLPEKLTDYTEGKIDLIITYTYDINDNLIQSKAVNEDSLLIFKETTTYDKNNNRIEHYHYLPDGLFKYKNIAKYDNKNRMIELAWYWPTGFRSRNIYTYDGDKKITDTEFSETGEQTYQWKCKYDSNNNLIEAGQYYPGNVMTLKNSYEYNKQNQLIKQTTYQGTTLSGSITFTYDSRNFLISKTEFTPSGKISSIFRYTYQ